MGRLLSGIVDWETGSRGVVSPNTGNGVSQGATLFTTIGGQLLRQVIPQYDEEMEGS